MADYCPFLIMNWKENRRFLNFCMYKNLKSAIRICIQQSLLLNPKIKTKKRRTKEYSQ